MMDKQERSALTAAFCNVVREYVAKTEEKLSKWVSGELRALSDLFEERIKAIPEPKPGKDGRDGKDADLEEVRKYWEEKYSHVVTENRLADLVLRTVEQLPKPKDGERGESIIGPPGPPGKDVDLEVVRSLVSEEVKRSVAALPVPKDGQDAPPVDTAVIINEVLTHIPTREYLEAEVQKAVAAIPIPKNGTDGKDADPELIRAAVVNEVTRAVSAIPIPKDGLPGKPGTSIVIGEGPPLSAGKPGDIYLDATTGEIYREEEVHVASNGKH